MKWHRAIAGKRVCHLDTRTVTRARESHVTCMTNCNSLEIRKIDGIEEIQNEFQCVSGICQWNRHCRLTVAIQ